jgi:hypothetical protein
MPSAAICRPANSTLSASCGSNRDHSAAKECSQCASTNFHLVGAGVKPQDGMAFTGNVTWHLDLVAGTYKFGSDPRLTGRLAVRAAG